MRVFFSNLRQDAGDPAQINCLDDFVMAHAPDRVTFDRAVGYDSEDLAHDEVDKLRPEVYLFRAQKATEPFLCKVHDAYAFLPDGRPMFPPKATAGVIYVIRNPLDVCASYAHHAGADDYDLIIERMANPHFALADGDSTLETQLRQRLLTWSGHVLSWINAPGVRLLVVRYEDMHYRSLETFAAVAEFAGLSNDPAQIERAMSNSSIKELQRQEQEHGFQEAVGGERLFFRKGKVGSWREELTSVQCARIINDHRDIMHRFGYLTEAGEPTF